MEKNTDNGFAEFIIWLFVIIAGAVIWAWLQAQKLTKEPYVTTRKILSKYYRVDVKTFNKWIELFADPAVLHYASFSKQRGITQKQNDYLLELFGAPTENKTKYSKADIVAIDEEIGPNDYRSVRLSIKKFWERYNITPEIYIKLNFFPPRIARELQQQCS